MTMRQTYARDGAKIRFVRRAAAVVGALGVFAIAYASLVPGEMRPHAGLPGPLEHFGAYAVTGFVLAIAYDALRVRVAWWAAMTIAAIGFEYLQNFIPGRGAGAIDAIASSSGLAAGLLAGAVAWRLASKAFRVAESI
jgi:VanZ family protein